MKIQVDLSDLISNARDLIGPDGLKDNPEYARGIVELIATHLPGDYEAAQDYLFASFDH